MTAFNFEMMSALLRETESQHALAEKRLPAHAWQDWYGAYMVLRMQGEHVTREDAAQLADEMIISNLVPLPGVSPGTAAAKATADVIIKTALSKHGLENAPATNDGVTIIDAPQTEVCDECGATVPCTGSMINPNHETTCSLHPKNLVE